jgi:hypothetical protein
MSQPIFKKYVAESVSGGVQVLVHNSDHPDDTTTLEPIGGGGFEWGYEGAGPRNLAYALLADCIPNRFCDDLMRELVANRSPIQEHRRAVVFTEEEILLWLRNRLKELRLDGR